MVHHGACVHEIVPPVRQRLAVNCQQIAERETLWRPSSQTIGTVRHLHRTVRVLHENGLHRRHTSHATTLLPSNVDALGNCLLQHKRPNTVMNQHKRIFRVVLLCKQQSIVDGILPRLSSWDNTRHFAETILLNLVAQIGNPILQAYHDDGIHHSILLEGLNRVNHNGLLAVFQKLLGAAEVIQSATLSAS